MAAKWFIEYGTRRTTLAAWKISDVKLRRISHGVDTLTFRAGHGNVDVNFPNPQFAYNEPIKLFRDGVQWFLGRVRAIEYNVSAPGEGITYTVTGPWWELENCVLQVPWYAYSNSGAAKGQVYTSHVLLNVTRTIAEEIANIVGYAEGAGAGLQTGAADLDLPIKAPIDEVRDMTVAEVIIRLLRWHPDAVAWFDYSQTPPRLKIKRRAALTRAPLMKFTDGGVDWRPRYDLVRPAVAIRYERSKSVNGQVGLDVIDDIYPAGKTGREIGALCFTVNLIGVKLSTLQADLECAPINISSIAFWKGLFPTLNDSTITGIAFTAGKPPIRGGLLNLPSYLVDGGIAEWMSVNGIQQEQEEFKCWLDITYRNPLWPAGKEQKVKSVPFSETKTSTNAITGTYSSAPDIQPGEAAPLGIAKYIYDSLSVLQYEGSFELVEEECSGKLLPGMIASVQSDKSGLGVIDAQIIETVEDIDMGTTNVRFAPTANLTVSDLVELLRS